MFIFRAIPDISDEFLSAYSLASILSKNTLVGFSPLSSDNYLPKFRLDQLKIFSNDVEPHSPSVWCGLPKNYMTISELNIGYINIWRENIKYYNILDMFDYYCILGEDNFLYPHEKIFNSNNNSGVFLYAIPKLDREIWQAVEAWMLSKCEEPLKIFAPFQNRNLYIKKIKELKDKYNCQKECFLTTPNFFTPEELIQEISSSAITIDLQVHKSISYPTIVAISSGITSIGTDLTFPRPLYMINKESSEKINDGSRMTCEIFHKYSLEDIVNKIDEVTNYNCIYTCQYDNSSYIYDFMTDIKPLGY